MLTKVLRRAGVLILAEPAVAHVGSVYGRSTSIGCPCLTATAGSVAAVVRVLRCGSKRPCELNARPDLSDLRISRVDSSSSTMPAASVMRVIGSSFGSSPRPRASFSRSMMRCKSLFSILGSIALITRLYLYATSASSLGCLHTSLSSSGRPASRICAICTSVVSSAVNEVPRLSMSFAKAMMKPRDPPPFCSAFFSHSSLSRGTSLAKKPII